MQIAQGQLRLVSITDEALDLDGMAPGTLGKYIDTRDYALIEPHFVFGKKPTVYVVKEIAHKLFGAVQDEPTERARAYAAFQAAVVRVENYRTDDGAIVTLGADMERYDSGALRDSELERFEPSELLEIGHAAFMHSFFRRKTHRAYPLPRMLREHWASQVDHHAAQTRMASEQNSAKPAPTTPSTASSSGATTDATAPESRHQAA